MLKRSVTKVVFGLAVLVVSAVVAPGAGATPAGVPIDAKAISGLLEPTLSELPPAAQRQHISAGLGANPSNDDAVSGVADLIYDMGRDNGFSGQRLNPASRAIEVYWKGSVPAAVSSYVGSHPYGVTVSISSGARFSRLEAAAMAVKLASNAQLANDIGLASASINFDGSGVVANVTKPITTERISAARSAVLSSGVELRGMSDLPRPQSRQDDAPPWKGGIRTIIGNGACSTAFAVLVGAEGRLVTAHHCDPTANATVTDGVGQVIAPGGNYVTSIPSIDSQLLDPTASPATVGKIYQGAYYSDTTVAVKGWSSNWTGQTVCNNGATSGTRCGTIINDATTIPGLSGSFYIYVQAFSGWLSAGGDSGGPWTASTSGGVMARGVHWGGQGGVACGSIDPGVVPSCTMYSWYVPISVVRKTWGVSLETS